MMKKTFLILFLFANLIISQEKIHYDQGNSSSTVLDSSATFTGTAINLTKFENWNSISVGVLCDHAGATAYNNNTLTIKFSSDGTYYDNQHSYSIPDSTYKFYSLPIQGKWMQVTFANDTVAQDEFRLQTLIYPESISNYAILVDSNGTIMSQLPVTTTSADVITVQQTTHDSLNGNANLQVGDADVSNSNPVPVTNVGLSTDSTFTLSVSGTATQLPSIACKKVNITHVTGGETIYLISSSAGTTANGYPIMPFDMVTRYPANANQYYLISDGTAVDARITIEN